MTINTRIVKHALAIGKGVVRGLEWDDPHQELNDCVNIGGRIMRGQGVDGDHYFLTSDQS